MAATGASPTYYDFDAFQEMTINTGGVDVTQQTGGVGINLVTKSGTDRFKGSARFYDTNDRVRGEQHHRRRMRSQGATSGNPIQNIKDYGVEMGGPIKQRPRVGVGQLRQAATSTSACSASTSRTPSLPGRSRSPRRRWRHDIEDVNDCLNTDTTLLADTNLKGEVQLFKGNKLSLYNSFIKKERNARGASDLNPIETTQRQAAVSKSFGKYLWNTGPNADLQVRRPVGVERPPAGRRPVRARRQQLHPRLPRGRARPTVQPDADRQHRPERPLGARRACSSARSTASTSTRTTSCPATLGGDHAFKFGGYWRDAYSDVDQLTPAASPRRASRRSASSTTTPAPLGVGAGCGAALTRDSHTAYQPDEHLGVRAGFIHPRQGGAAARHPRGTATTTRRWRRPCRRAASSRRCCPRSSSAASIRRSCSTTSRRASA